MFRFILIALVLCGLAFGDDHSKSPIDAQTPQDEGSHVITAKGNDNRLLQLRTQIEELLAEIEANRKESIQYPLAKEEAALQSFLVRLQAYSDKGASLVPSWSSEDLSVLSDNVAILMEFSREVMNAVDSNPGKVDASQVRQHAASNLEKKWRILAAKKKQAWEIAENEAELLTTSGKEEFVRRSNLISKKDPAVFESFAASLLALPEAARPPIAEINALREKVEKIVDDFKVDPESFLRNETEKLRSALRSDGSEASKRAEVVIKKYEEKRKDYEAVLEKIKDTKLKDVPQSTKDEIRSHSEDLHQAESDLHVLLEGLGKALSLHAGSLGEALKSAEDFLNQNRVVIEHEVNRLKTQAKTGEQDVRMVLDKHAKQLENQAKRLEADLRNILDKKK